MILVIVRLVFWIVAVETTLVFSTFTHLEGFIHLRGNDKYEASKFSAFSVTH